MSFKTFIRTDMIATPVLLDKKNQFIVKRTELYDKNPQYEHLLSNNPKCIRALINIFIYYPDKIIELYDKMVKEHAT